MCNVHISYSVQSTPNMRSMFFIGGLGHAPQENLKNRHQEMQSGNLSASKQLA